MFRTRLIAKVATAIAVLMASFLVSANPASAVPTVRVVPLDAGGNNTCALRAANEVFCVGDDSVNQLGDGSTTNKTEPISVQVSGAQSVSVGAASSCAIGSNQKGYCWGDNSKGQLGNTLSGGAARQISLDAKLVDISVGESYACAVTVEEKLYCWGEFANQSGTLSSTTPVLVTQPTGVKSVSVGKSAVCVITTAIQCFGPLVGSNSFTQVDRSLGATGVSVGDNFACFLAGSIVRCLGNNSQGQLGVGNSTATSAVVDVAGISDAVSVVAGGQHACALNTSGSVFCWGDNSASQITSGTSDQVNRVPISLGSAASIAAGRDFTCVLLLDASIRCIGDSSAGQTAMLTSSAKPLGSASTQDLIKLSAGSDTTCVINQQGRISCYGTIKPELERTATYSDIAVGYVSSCAITGSGTISCWGSNSSGQLGDGTNKTANFPTNVVGLGTRQALGISAGYRHFCTALNDGLAMCWGDNSKDQLGFTGADSKSATPVPGIGNATVVSSGDYHSCALLATKKVMCWGDNSKKQISSAAALKLAPVELTLAKDVQKVVASGFNTCFLYTDSTAECIGDNSESQAPGLIAGSFRDIAVGGKTVCLIRSFNTGGLVTCLGSNSFTKLGRVGLKSATLVDMTLSADKVSVGLGHVCTIGSPLQNLACWGDNSSGQLASSFGFPSAYADPLVALSGIPNVGETLTASIGNAEASANIEYSWYRSSEANGTFSKVASATSNKLVLATVDQGKYFKAYVTLKKWGTNSKTFKSSVSNAIGKQTRILITPIPLVIGKAKVGELLIARTGSWDVGTTLTYKWYRGGWVIGGETKSYYRIGSMDIGKQISVAVTGTKSGYPKVIRKSQKTSKVTR